MQKVKSSAHSKPKAPRRKVTPALARKRLIELHGFKEDELSVLFASDEALVEAYVAVKNNLTKADKLPTDATDSFEIPSEDMESVNASERNSAEEAARLVVESDPDAKVSAEEIAAANMSLKELISSDTDL